MKTAPRTLLFVFALLGLRFAHAGGQTPAADPFASHVIGEWTGQGEYEGNALSLTRSWTLELGGHFLRADMRVSMPNGAAFGSLTYWRWLDNGTYDIIWLDGIGRMQRLRAARDRGRAVVSSSFLDELAENGPEWRRWEFHETGENSYVERLFAQRSGEWVLLAEFRFERTSGG